MKTSHRTATRAKRNRDPMASVHVLAANSEQPEANADRIMVLLRVAFEKLKLGTAEDFQFDRLAAAINVGLVRAEMIDPLCEQTMVLGVKAMMHCDEIKGRHGRYGFAGPQMLNLCDALDLYEQILRNSTPKQMLDALDVAAARMRGMGVTA